MSKAQSPPEQVLTGRQLRLPMVYSVSSLNSRNASRITWHRHAGYECLYLIDGATEYEFHDGRTVPLPGGSFMIVPPRTSHRGLHDVRCPARLCSIQVRDNPSGSSQNSPFAISERRWMLEKLTASQGNAATMNAELRRLTKSLADRIREYEPGRIETVAGLRLLICELMLETARQLTHGKNVLPSQAVQAAIQFMEENYADAISITDIAKQVDFSRSRLFQAFKSATGMTPNDYLQRIRLAKAAMMLKTTNLDITAIAMECGFSTSQYFSFVFSKYHNLPPRKFREQSDMS